MLYKVTADIESKSFHISVVFDFVLFVYFHDLYECLPLFWVILITEPQRRVQKLSSITLICFFFYHSVGSKCLHWDWSDYWSRGQSSRIHYPSWCKFTGEALTCSSLVVWYGLIPLPATPMGNLTLYVCMYNVTTQDRPMLTP